MTKTIKNTHTVIVNLMSVLIEKGIISFTEHNQILTDDNLHLKIVDKLEYELTKELENYRNEDTK